MGNGLSFLYPVVPKCPCRGCGKREIGCHGKCGEYADWSAEVRRINQIRWEYEQQIAMSRTQSAWLRKEAVKKKNR